MVLGSVDTAKPENASVGEQAEAGVAGFFGFMALLHRDVGFAPHLFGNNQSPQRVHSVNDHHAHYVAWNEGLHHWDRDGLETRHNRRFGELRYGDAEHFCSPHRNSERRPPQFRSNTQRVKLYDPFLGCFEFFFSAINSRRIDTMQDFSVNRPHSILVSKH